MKLHVIALWVLPACLAASFFAGCARKEERVEMPVVDAGVRVKPVDHLAPGELVEGTEKAFALTLPRVMRIDRTFEDVVFASGAIPPEPVAKYIEAHVREGTIKQTAEGHVFDKVRVPGETKLLHILVERAPVGGGTRIQVRDVTPRPVVNDPPDEESRWRAVGLKPNGEPLDRTKLR